MRYREHPHPGEVTFSWTRHESDGRVLLEASGQCPVCGCAMSHTFTHGQSAIPKGGGFLGRRQDPGSGVWQTRCRCDSYHFPRPAEATDGCGAWLRLADPPAAVTAPDGGS
ncbi:hypothetical protein ACFRAO_42445 [Streptomyces sp. NPDC056656]|uniref:hypothetical protein n=1 Tax=Streptomyces sp. NPDC056656 TaxID=3345895 RepID=UPI0036B1F09C